MKYSKAYLFCFTLVFFMTALPEAHAQKRERYKSENSLKRYDSKDRSSRRDFDKNFDRYQTLSPQQKREKMDKWRDFKSNTTPEEREYIMQKMRKKRQGGRR